MVDEGLKQGFQDLLGEDKEDTIDAIKLLTDTDDVDAKTDIPSPFSLAIMDALQKHLEKQNMKKSADFIDKVTEKFKLYQISKGRKSREEMLEMAKSFQEQTTVEDAEGSDLMKRR